MMNSSVDDDFPPNPFRSGDGGIDPFNPSPQQQQQPPPMQQQQFQQQQQQQAMPQQQFQPQFQQQQQPFSGQMQQQQQQQPNAPQSTPTSYWGMCTACFRLESYRGYFDVDTVDVKNRVIAAVTHFHQPQYFRDQVVGVEQGMNQAAANTEMKGPDLYGPFWITMTLIFLVAATANWSASLRSSNDVTEFEYDINHLIRASSFFTAFVFGVPTVFWLCTRCMAMTGLTWAEWVCYYGYSMVPFLPASLLCIIPLNFIIWLVLFAASGASGLLVLRNASTPLLASDPGHQKAPALILAMLAAHVILFFSIGITFYHHGNAKHMT